MSGILSDQQPVRTDEFEGRHFPVRQGAEQEYWQCDRCSRNYATIVAAARCANPNHSQIFGPRPERHTEPGLAAKANGGVRAGDDGETHPVRRGRPAKHATDEERRDAVRASNRASMRRASERDPAVAEKREAWQATVAAVQESAPPNGRVSSWTDERVSSWTDERKRQHAESMRRHHEERRAAKAAAAPPPPPPPEKEAAPMPEHVNGRNKIEWTPERRAAHGELMKRKAAEKRAQAAPSPASKPKAKKLEIVALNGVAPVTARATSLVTNADIARGILKPVPGFRFENARITDRGVVADVVRTPSPSDPNVFTLADGRTVRISDPTMYAAMAAFARRMEDIARAMGIIADVFGTEVSA